MEKSLNEIQTVINNLLNVKSLVRRKKKTLPKTPKPHKNENLRF